MLKVRSVFYILLFYRYNTHHGHECHGRFGLLMIYLNFLFSRWNSSCRLKPAWSGKYWNTSITVHSDVSFAMSWTKRVMTKKESSAPQLIPSSLTAAAHTVTVKFLLVKVCGQMRQRLSSLTTKIRVWVFGWVKAFEPKNTTEAVNYGGVGIMILGCFAASGTESSAILQLHLKTAAGQLKPGHSSKHTSKLVL